MKNTETLKDKLNIKVMIGLIMSTLILSPIGIIIGAVNFKHVERRM